MKPTDACMEALSRVVRNYNSDKTKLYTFNIRFYAVNKDGEYGSASLWKKSNTGSKDAMFAVHDGTQARLVPCKAFYDESAHEE
jgi:hypothetical protein